MRKRVKTKKQRIQNAAVNVQRLISEHAKGGFFASGLASEGWNGGYVAALNDVLLLLNGVIPDRSFWKD